MSSQIAHAKINLALHVVGQRQDGYHLLDTLVLFTKFGDKINLQEGDNDHPLQLTMTGPFAQGLSVNEDNLVLKAARLLRAAAKENGSEIKPVSITLEKNLPIASGIGGGSADAAATLLALVKFWELGETIDLFPIANALGADVSMCLHSTPLRAQGIGEDISNLEMARPLHMILVNPGLPVSTPDIFRNLQSKNNAPIELQNDRVFPDLTDIKNMRNDLELPAIEVEPKISEVLSEIKSRGSMLVRMSGSGATCFGVFEDEKSANAACDAINHKRLNWWCVATSTVTQ